MSHLISTKIFQPYLEVAQRGPVWDAARKKHLGASDFAAAAAAEGAYTSRRALYKKIKGIKQTVPNLAMRYGTDNEVHALDAFREEFGEVCQVGMVLYDGDPYKSCSPDGIWVQPEDFRYKLPDWSEHDPRWLVEFKCPFSGVKYADVPPHHQVQVLAQMEICGIHKVLYCVWTPYGKDQLDVWAVKYDPDQWKELEKRVDQFLRDHVTAGVEPGVHRGSKFSPDLERIKLNRW